MLLGVEDQDWPKIRQVVAEVHPVGDRVLRVCGLLRDRGFNVSTQVKSIACLTCTTVHTVHSEHPFFVARVQRYHGNISNMHPRQGKQSHVSRAQERPMLVPEISPRK